MQLQWPFFYQPKWFHYRGFSYSLTQGCREGLARGWDAGGTVRIIKVTVGIIIPAMERASKPLFSSPAQMHCPWLLVTKNFVINGASTYYLYEWGKKEQERGRLVSTWQFSIIKTNDRHGPWGSRGTQKREHIQVSAECWPPSCLCWGLNSSQKKGKSRPAKGALLTRPWLQLNLAEPRPPQQIV